MRKKEWKRRALEAEEGLRQSLLLEVTQTVDGKERVRSHRLVRRGEVNAVTLNTLRTDILESRLTQEVTTFNFCIS